LSNVVTDSPSLAYRELRKLSLAPGSHPRQLRFLSAASGLVRVRDRFYVVADDEHHLGSFQVGSLEPLSLIRFFEGDLPASAKPRKKRKPDLESILVLPPSPGEPGGCLLALGSGSRPNRFKGALVSLDSRGDVEGPARVIDLNPLYSDLSGRFDEINIEGAFVAMNALVLLQRGVERGTSAVIRFDLVEVMAWLNGRTSAVLLPRSVRVLQLDEVNGVPFAFTDGAALPDGSWVFSAVAEARDDSYSDGPCLGCAIGICSDDDDLQMLRPLVPNRKVEGIEADVVGSTIHLHLVTDADDPNQAAELGTARISL